MTPEELEIVLTDGARVRQVPDLFSRTFYDTLFEIAPSTRELFPADMSAQRGKLVDELAFLVDAAAASGGPEPLGPFLARARDLGRRHAGYGVGIADYEPVRAALIAALRAVVDEFDAASEQAWNKLYRLIASVMRDDAPGSDTASVG